LTDKTNLANVGNERNEDLLKDIQDLKNKVTKLNDTNDGLRREAVTELQTSNEKIEHLNQSYDNKLSDLKDNI
jgi:hypothetical protein